MMVVAMVALALGAARLWPRVQVRRAQARQQDRDAALWRQAADWSAQRRVVVRRDLITPALRKYLVKRNYDAKGPYFYDWKNNNYNGPTYIGPSQEEYRDELTAICRERAAYHERMGRKWHWAAWLPWTDVAPDPPRPPVDGRVTDMSYAF